jgi:hypothetical protein
MAKLRITKSGRSGSEIVEDGLSIEEAKNKAFEKNKQNKKTNSDMVYFVA